MLRHPDLHVAEQCSPVRGSLADAGSGETRRRCTRHTLGNDSESDPISKGMTCTPPERGRAFLRERARAASENSLGGQGEQRRSATLPVVCEPLGRRA